MPSSWISTTQWYVRGLLASSGSIRRIVRMAAGVSALDYSPVFSGAPTWAQSPRGAWMVAALVAIGLYAVTLWGTFVFDDRVVIREAKPGHFYLDEEVWHALGRTRRRVSIAVLALIVVLIVAVLAVGRLIAPS